MKPQLEQLQPAGDRGLRLGEVGADRDLTGPQGAPYEARIGLGAIADREFNFLGKFGQHSQGVPGLRMPPVGRHE